MAATAGWWLEQRDRDLLAADALTFTPNALELRAAAAGTRRNARPEFNEQTVIAPIRLIRAELEPLEPTNSTRPLVQPQEPGAESKPSAGAKSILRRAFKTTNALNIARRGALVLTTCILVGLFAGSQLGNAASDRSRQPAVRHPAAIASAQRVQLAPAESEPSKPAPSATSVATPSGVVEVVQVSPVLGASSAAPSSSPLASAGNVTGGNPHPVGRPVAVKPSARSSWVVRKTTKAGPDGF